MKTLNNNPHISIIVIKKFNPVSPARLAEVLIEHAAFFDKPRPKSAVLSGFTEGTCIAAYATDTDMAARVFESEQSAAEFIVERTAGKVQS